ncbi:fimbrial protein [Pseudomonas fuscovaginae UPB0736]|uniref:fimbrial protein n=1 Tax=Pseudomonas asplenii TaxID=53407 RepID=UPI001E28784D|nr:fimbrial protein [Pseudomonas fuscovaginae]UUQ67734.1 fimbrial protein [Pseudomonas fuscovaginae UPB0736]
MIGPYQAIPAAALLLCISGQAFAACSSSVYHPGGYSGDIGTVTVTNIDGPVGSTLSGWRDFPSISQGTKRVSWYCSSRTDVKFSAQGAAGAVSSYSEAGRTYSVYPTGMPGIGIVFKTNGNTQVGAHNTITGIQSNITQRRYSQTNLSASNKTYAYEIDYRLIKTGSISSGNIIPRVIARTWWEPVPTNFDPREYNILLGRGTIIAPLPTCDLNVGDTNRTITLDTVRLSNFTGNWLAKKTFDISANCRNASNVTFRFTGTPATGHRQCVDFPQHRRQRSRGRPVALLADRRRRVNPQQQRHADRNGVERPGGAATGRGLSQDHRYAHQGLAGQHRHRQYHLQLRSAAWRHTPATGGLQPR